MMHESDVEAEIAHLHTLIGERKKALGVLEQQAARFGLHVPHYIVVEITEITTQITACERKIATLYDTHIAAMLPRPRQVDHALHHRNDPSFVHPTEPGRSLPSEAETRPSEYCRSPFSGFVGRMTTAADCITLTYATGDASPEAQYAVAGAMARRYSGLGDQRWATLGFPITEAQDAVASPFDTQAQLQAFENGVMICPHDSLMAGSCFMLWGRIARTYIAAGGIESPLGQPVSDISRTDGAIRCDFEGGAILAFDEDPEAQIVYRLFALRSSDSPFTQGWRQYDGVQNPICLTTRLAQTIGYGLNYVALTCNVDEAAVEYFPPPVLEAAHLSQRYCAITLRSLAPGERFRCFLHVETQHKTLHYLVLDSHLGESRIHVDRRENVRYGFIPLPAAVNDGGWHTVMIDHSRYTQQIFKQPSQWINRFCFRGQIGIADIILSKTIQALEAIAVNPMNV